MKRMHFHVSVDDLDKSIGFYSTLFGVAPSVTKADYAKWMLDDPRVNFAISARGVAAGLDHIGIQVDERSELNELSGRLKTAWLLSKSHSGTGYWKCCRKPTLPWRGEHLFWLA